MGPTDCSRFPLESCHLVAREFPGVVAHPLPLEVVVPLLPQEHLPPPLILQKRREARRRIPGLASMPTLSKHQSSFRPRKQEANPPPRMAKGTPAPQERVLPAHSSAEAQTTDIIYMYLCCIKDYILYYIHILYIIYIYHINIL